MGTSKQTYIHTTSANAVTLYSVGLAQARPNKQSIAIYLWAILVPSHAQ